MQIGYITYGATLVFYAYVSLSALTQPNLDIEALMHSLIYR